VRAIPAHDLIVWSVALYPPCSYSSRPRLDHAMKIWRSRTARRATLRGHTQAVLEARFSPDGTLIASGGDDATVRIWRAADGGPCGR
jgi:WD40 repeat protein